MTSHTEPSSVPTGPESFPDSGPNSLSGIAPRFWARLLDTMILAVPSVVIFASTVELPDSNDVANVEVPFATTAVILGISVVYEVVFIAWRGQTPGKMALGVRVAAFADGTVPSWSAASIRALLPAAVGVLPAGIGLLAVLVYASAIWDPLNRGWHDKAAGTVVVRTR